MPCDPTTLSFVQWCICLWHCWCREARTRRLRMLVKYPHHYTTAAGLSALLYAFGHLEAAALCCLWGYALIDNITSLEGD